MVLVPVVTLVVLVVGLVLHFHLSGYIHGKKYAFTPPEEMSAVWEDFFHDRFKPINGVLLRESEEDFIYEISDFGKDRRVYVVSRRGMASIYEDYVKESSFDRGQHRIFVNKLLSPFLTSTANRIGVGIPEVVVDEAGVLHVETAESKREFSFDDPVRYAFVSRVVGDVFSLSVSTEASDHYLYLLTWDLETEYVLETDYLALSYEEDSVSREYTEQFAEFISDERFDTFAELFPRVEGEERYILSNRNELFDTVEEEFILFREDLLSKDGKYVYIDGSGSTMTTSKLDEGEQYIQALGDYLAGKENYAAEFSLHYNSISKALKLLTGGSNYQEIIYFNDTLVVYRLSYRGVYIGTFGEVIVAVDYSGDDVEIILLDVLEN